MIRKVVGNLIICFIIPFLLKIRWMPNLYEAIFYKEYRYYDVEINSFSEFFYYIYGETYFIIYSLSFLLFLTPFQFVKDYFYRKGHTLSYLKKVVILMLIIICCILIVGTFSNIWTYPYWHNVIYIIFSIFISVILTTMTYFVIDKHVENQK